MSIPIVRNQPLNLHGNRKNDVRTQFGALCWRVRKKKLQIALITSRRTGRWIIPKGWPVEGATPTEAAAQEAWEEAGIEGTVGHACLGIFSYAKAVDDGVQPCVVAQDGDQDGNLDDVWLPTTNRIPPVGTAVTVTIKPAIPSKTKPKK